MKKAIVFFLCLLLKSNIITSISQDKQFNKILDLKFPTIKEKLLTKYNEDGGIKEKIIYENGKLLK